MGSIGHGLDADVPCSLIPDRRTDEEVALLHEGCDITVKAGENLPAIQVVVSETRLEDTEIKMTRWCLNERTLRPRGLHPEGFSMVSAIQQWP